MKSPRDRHASRLLAAVPALLALNGCASGVFDSELPAQTTYVIAALPPQSPAATPLVIDLAVARPIARPGLDSDRIAVQYADRRLDTYARSRWGGNADLVVQSLLIESLRNSGRLHSVQPDLSPFASQYLLQTELRDFQAEYATEGAVPAVHVTLVGTVGSTANRKTLASFTATATVPATANNLRAVVAAFESAFQQVARTTVDEALNAITAANSTPAVSTGSTP